MISGADIPTWRLALDLPPKVEWAGVGIHGHREHSQAYRVHRLWCIHWYDYTGEVQIGDWIGKIEPGVLSIVPPDHLLVHRWRRTNSRHYFAHFSTGAQAVVPNSIPAWIMSADNSLGRLMEDVGTQFLSNPARAVSALWQCLWKITESAPPSACAGLVGTAEAIQRHIERNLTQAISLDAVAHKVGLSANHANQIFKRVTGGTICAYWRKRRVESACALLRHTSMSIKEAAIQCGYSDLQQFNKLVRLHIGVSPRRVRTNKVQGNSIRNPQKES